MEHAVLDVSASLQHHRHLHIVIMSKDDTELDSCLKGQGSTMLSWVCNIMSDSI